MCFATLVNIPMSNCEEKYDQDVRWFYDQAEKIGKRPTIEQEESFAERVSIIAADGVDEADARRAAFKGMFEL